MSLVTACPECSTPFHIRESQLAANNGIVRCGKCGHVFDALSRLSETTEPTALPEKSAVPESPPPIVAIPRNVPDTASKLKLAVPARHRAPLWLLIPVAVLFLLLAALQSIYYLRTPIAAQWPQLRPHLELACDLAGCKIPLPQQAELLAIIDSDLQEDAEREGLIHLSATIVNNAPFIQAYPVLELTLTNNYDKPVIRRPFTAQEYLLGQNAGKGIMPGDEVDVRLALTVNDDAVAGYRLFVTYPAD